MQKISVLGCGWLGIPLSKTLLAKGFLVKGSTTSEGKIAVLKASGIDPYLVSLSANGIAGDIAGFLADSSILIIDIPPKLRGGNTEHFPSKIRSLIPEIEKSGIQKVLFISSIAVYADDNSVVTESTFPNPGTESGKQLLEAERLLQENQNFETTILRFGGLIGEDRHPVKFLAGKENLENPYGPVNLIHLADCIGTIIKIIALNIWNETFNAVAPFHPSRKDYYTRKAFENHLEIPMFTTSKPSIGKTIDSKKLIDTLDYEFHVNLL